MRLRKGFEPLIPSVDVGSVLYIGAMAEKLAQLKPFKGKTRVKIRL